METSRISGLRTLVESDIESHLRVSDEVSVVQMCEQLEEYLPQLLRNVVAHEIRLIAEETKTRFSLLSRKRLFFDQVMYEVKVTEYVTSNSILQVGLHGIGPVQRSKFVRKPLKVKIDALGRYTEVHIATDEVFRDYQASIADATRTVLETSYRWLSEFARTALDKLQDKAADSLYSHLRRRLPERLVENIFLWKIVDNKGVYILDNLVRRAALHRASHRNLGAVPSPIESVANFSTTLIDLDRVISKIAITENRTLQDDLLNAKYAETGLDVAELAIYESRGFTTQPLVRDGPSCLMAAYPAELRGEIEAVLERERGDLRLILEQASSARQEIVSQVTNQGALPKVDTEAPGEGDGLVKKSEWLELKPNLFGIGININKMIIDLSKKYRGKK